MEDKERDDPRENEPGEDDDETKDGLERLGREKCLKERGGL